MTVTSTTRRAGPYSGNGVTTAFPFTFKVFSASDIALTLTDADGISSALVLDTDYSITLNPDQDTSPGGTITYPLSGAPLAGGETLVGVGSLPYDQTTDFPPGGKYRAQTVESAFDRTVQQIQQLAEVAGRSLSLPPSAATANTELPAPVATNVIGWNEDATALVNYAPADLATVVVAGTSYFQAFSGDGTATQFVLTANPGSVNALDIAVDGVPQKNGIDFTVSGTTLTFTSAPGVGTQNIAVRYVAAVPVGSANAQDVTFLQAGTGAVPRDAQDKLREWVSVKDFGAVGTANIANQAADTAAFTAALASGRKVYIPDGTYYLSSSFTIGTNTSLVGSGSGKVTIYYSGTSYAFLVGAPGPSVTLTYYCVLGGFTLICTNRASTVKGVVCSNMVYSDVFDITAIGSGSPNSGVPADRVLYGYGLEVTNNSILSRITNVNCRIWNYGAYFYTASASASNWAAALEVQGCEFANNMYNLVLGDPAVSFTSCPGVNFRGVWIQGGFTEGLRIYSAQSVLFSGCYWEGNANYDVYVGGGANLPVEVVFDTCYMDGEDIGTTNYGTFPYIAKVRAAKGEAVTLRNCDLSITKSIPLVINDAGATLTKIYDCRLNSLIGALSRIQINGGTVQTQGNNPERPRMAAGSAIRNCSTAPGTVVYSGVGFLPTKLSFRATIVGFGPPGPWSIGDAGLGNGAISVCTFALPNGAISHSSTHCIEIQISAGNGIRGQLSAVGNDTFSIAWTQFGVPGASDVAIQWVATRDD